MSVYYVYTFASSHGAIEAQSVLKEVHPTVMPTLRAISATCGISLKIPPEDIVRVRELLASSQMDLGALQEYKVTNEDGQLIIEK